MRMQKTAKAEDAPQDPQPSSSGQTGKRKKPLWEAPGTIPIPMAEAVAGMETSYDELAADPSGGVPSADEIGAEQEASAEDRGEAA